MRLVATDGSWHDATVMLAPIGSSRLAGMGQMKGEWVQSSPVSFWIAGPG